MRALSAALVLSLVTGAAACGEDDPFTADMKMICGAAARHRDLPPDLQRMQAMRDIAERIRTAEAARLMAAVMQAAPSERAALLAPALQRAKLGRCPTLEP